MVEQVLVRENKLRPMKRKTLVMGVGVEVIIGVIQEKYNVRHISHFTFSNSSH